MELAEILGFLGALIIGIVLGLIGGGGSTLTVPILVYVMGISPVIATAYSLFVVGSSALVGAIINAKKRMVDFRMGIVFAIPAFLAVFLTRKYLVPAIPNELFSVGDFLVTKDIAIMVFFAIIMLLASYFMIKKRKDTTTEETTVQYNYPFIIIEGIVVGVLTGIVGAGGGFLIIPALVLLTGLSMNVAVATSLFIIASKSLMGFGSDLIDGYQTDWMFVLYVCIFTLAGVFFGRILSKKVSDKQTKKLFGYMTLIISCIIIIEQIIF